MLGAILLEAGLGLMGDRGGVAILMTGTVEVRGVPGQDDGR